MVAPLQKVFDGSTGHRLQQEPNPWIVQRAAHWNAQIYIRFTTQSLACHNITLLRFQVLEVAVKRQNLQRAFVRQALDTLDHGFDALDRNLIYHASLVGDLYEEFYRRFAQTVQVLFWYSLPLCTIIRLEKLSRPLVLHKGCSPCADLFATFPILGSDTKDYVIITGEWARRKDSIELFWLDKS